MPRADWRSPGAYDDKRTLDAKGFAFEFLCRNPAFLRDHGRLLHAHKRGTLTSAACEDFAQIWGLRFRGESPDLTKPCPTLDAGCATERCCAG